MNIRLLPLLSVSLLVVCCASHRTVTTVPVETVRRDTVHMYSHRYDSVYLYNNVSTVHNGDTLLVRDTRVEYRYRLLRDTVRLVRRDSVPYEVRVTEYRDVPRRRGIADYAVYTVLGAVVLMFVWRWAGQFVGYNR